MCRIENERKLELLYLSLSHSLSATHLIYYVGEVLAQGGYVLPGWSEDVLQREEQYPTGLHLESGNMAIPHPQGSFNKREALVIVSLREPTCFYNMENPKQALLVRLVLFPIFIHDGQMTDFLAGLLSYLSTESDAKQLFSITEERELISFFDRFCSK